MNSYRHWGCLEEPKGTDDLPDTEDLTSDEEWLSVADIRFSLSSSQGSDTDSDEQRDHIVRYDLETRYRPDIKTGMRINMDGRHLNFVGVPIDKDQRRQRLSIQVEELIA